MLKLPPPFSTSLLSNWKLGLWLESCPKGWEVSCSFMQKFTSAARCSAGQSGFQVALGGKLAKWFFCLSFLGIFPEGCENNFVFVNSFPCL